MGRLVAGANGGNTGGSGPARGAARGAPKGRGAGINPESRFVRYRREPVATEDDDAAAAGAPPTEVREERATRIVSRNESPDIGFDRSINPYRGCEHGCVYCFARPTHAYLDLSPGLDFETRLAAKVNAPDLLRRELAARGYAARPIVLGANTDAYQPLERTRGIARGVLEVLAETRHPVTIVTKGTLVARDLDLLGPMAAEGLAKVCVSVTTLDGDLARRLEPRAPRPDRRLETIAALAAAGVPTVVLMAPVVPAINDPEIEAVLAAAGKAGASHAGYVLLRLPREVETIFGEWLLRHYPDRARCVMELVRATRGGKAYDSRWGKRLVGEGPYAEMIARRFALAARRAGLSTERIRLRTDLFRPPAGVGGAQLSLL